MCKQALLFLKEKKQKNSDCPRFCNAAGWTLQQCWSGQPPAVKAPGLTKVFFAFFFKKALLS
jgi:hypothetical protein